MGCPIAWSKIDSFQSAPICNNHHLCVLKFNGLISFANIVVLSGSKNMLPFMQQDRAEELIE